MTESARSDPLTVGRPIDVPTILTLQIDKKASAVYQAFPLVNGVEVTEPSIHTSIEAAIRAVAADVPAGFAQFLEVRYQGFSSGTLVLEDVADGATEAANRLNTLVGRMHVFKA